MKIKSSKNCMNSSNIHVLARAVIVQDAHILLSYDPRSNPYLISKWLDLNFNDVFESLMI